VALKIENIIRVELSHCKDKMNENRLKITIGLVAAGVTKSEKR
jgi:hypothetical protein